MSDNVYLAQMSADMEEARKKASFSIESMVYLLRGGKEAYEKSNKIRELAEREPLLDKSVLSFQSRQEVI